MKRFLLLSFTFILSAIPSLSQIRTTYLEGSYAFDIKHYAGWQKIETLSFTFYIPPILNRKDTICYEGDCYRFESPDLLLWVTPNAGHPTFEKRYPSYSQTVADMNGLSAWYWSFEEPDEVYKYRLGVSFLDAENQRWIDGLYLYSKTPDNRQTAEKIYKSIVFNQKSNR